MDKHKLLTEFYSSINKTCFKLETTKGSFDYLEHLKTLGELEYSEWKNTVFKYKLNNIESLEFEKLIDLHIAGEINYCAYLGEKANNIFCFNLDSFNEDYTNLKIVAIYLIKDLLKLNIEPLILSSGHGYHIWVRLEENFDNLILLNFMENMMDIATFQAISNDVNIKDLQCIFYPRLKFDDISIRLFGTTHTVTKKFISVVGKIDREDTLLNEFDSWQFFSDYLSCSKVSSQIFEFAIKSAEQLAKTVK